MRFATILCLSCVMALSAALSAARVEARGADAKEVGRNLLERGYKLLRRAEGHLGRGDEASAARDAREADRIFEAVLNQEPRNAQAALLGGQAATLSGDMRRAKGWVERLGKIAPGGLRSPDYFFLVAFVQILGDKRPDRGLRTLTRMYSLNPRARAQERDNLWFRALSDHGAKLLQVEKYTQAVAQFRMAVHIARRLGNPTLERGMLANVGMALLRAKRFIEATEIYTGLIKKQPKHPLWHFRLAVSHANQTRFANAIPSYRETIRLIDAGHTYPGWQVDLGMVHLRLGNCLRNFAEQQRDPKLTAKYYTQAETHIRNYMKSEPKDQRGHKWLGVLLFENLNKPYEALPHFEKAFALDEVCDDSLRYMVQIRRTYPAPKGMTLEVWRKDLPALAKDLKEGHARRKKAREDRVHEDPGDTCN